MKDRITAPVEAVWRVSLPQPVHPALAAAQSSQAVDPAFALDHMILLLQPSNNQQIALASLINQQQDPASSQFHHFLTPAQFAASFGVSNGDLAQITAWLTASGFQIEDVAASQLAIVFSGTAAQVETTFHTQIRRYIVNREAHYANATPPQVPAAFSHVIQGFVKLNDFHSKTTLITPALTRPALAKTALLKEKAHPEFTSGSGSHALAPADFATIYDLYPLYNAGVSGTGQTIAVVGRSNINANDIATFRSTYGLPAGNIKPVLATGIDPGMTGDDSTLETTADVEWAGAVAPAATIDYVIAPSTPSTDGVDLAMQYAVNHSVAPILSVSYGVCEATANNAFYNTLWKQAAAQGITVLVAAGDSGAAECDSPSATAGTSQAINAICSTPYDTCVGGTLFNDSSNPGQYWLPGNNEVLGSAVSYIPEIAWNESAFAGGSGLTAGGGGVSSIYSKPYWQYIAGVPLDGHRDVPDVALTAAQHDGYLLFYSGASMTVAGTSIATPAFAGIMALVSQTAGASQGNINQVLYPLATRTNNVGIVFHDITAGNNSVTGVTGYPAGSGYDLVTGLGSVDGAGLANNWTSVAGGFNVTASANTVNITPTVNGKVTLTITDFASFNSPVTLSLSGVPSNVTASFVPAMLTGSGSSVLTISAGGNALSGTFSITVTAKGGNLTRTASFNLVVVVTTGCTLSATPTSLTMLQGRSATTKLVCGNAEGTFSNALTLAVSGTPAGVTVSFSPSATLTAGTGTRNLLVSAATNTVPGSYTLQVTATLPNATPAFSSTVSLPVTINAPATFSVTPSATALSLLQGALGTITLTSLHSGSFNSAVNFSVSGLPSSVAASFSVAALPAPGDGVVTLNLQVLSTTSPGAYNMTVLAQGGGISLKLLIPVQVTAAPSFSLTASAPVMTLRQTYTATGGAVVPGTATLVFASGTLTNSFNSTVAFSIGTLPMGVTAVFSSPSIAAPGNGTTMLTLTAAATAPAGISTFIVTAAGGNITKSLKIQLTVTTPPTFHLAINSLTFNQLAGGSFSQTVTSLPLFGYNSTIQLAATVQAGMTASFSPISINGAYGTSKLTIQSASTMAAGSYPVVITGTDPSSGDVKSTQINVVIETVVTTINNPIITLARGASGNAILTTVTTGFSGDVALSLTGLPAGVSHSFSPTFYPNGSGSSTLTLTTAATTVPGTYQVTIQSSAIGIAFTTTFTLTIT